MYVSFWRILNKVCFYICISLCALLHMLVSIIALGTMRIEKSYTWFDNGRREVEIHFFTPENIKALLVVLGGLLLLALLFTVWGIMLEFFYNIKELRDMVCCGKIKIKPKGDNVAFLAAEPTACEKPSLAQPFVEPVGYEPPAAAPPPADNGGAWVCPGCGSVNDATFLFCDNCGYKKTIVRE